MGFLDWLTQRNPMRDQTVGDYAPAVATMRGRQTQQNTAQRTDSPMRTGSGGYPGLPSGGFQGARSNGPFTGVQDTKGRLPFHKGFGGPVVKSGRPQQVQEPELPQFGRSLSDYLADAQGMFGSQEVDLSAFDQQEAALKSRAGESDARIAAIYNELTKGIQGMDPEIKQRYDEAQQATQQNSQAHAEAASEGYNDASETANATMANLGIQAAAPIAGRTAAAHQSAATGDIAQRGQAATQHLISGGLTNRNYNSAVAQGAMTEGAGRRAGLQSDLAQMLASLQSARAQAQMRAQQESQGQAMDWAAKLYGADYGQFNDQRGYSDNRDDEAWRRAMQSEQFALDAQPEPPKMQEDPTGYGQSATRLSSMGVDPGTAIPIYMASLNGVGSLQDYLKKVERGLAGANLTPQQQLLAKQEAMEFFNKYGG